MLIRNLNQEVIALEQEASHRRWRIPVFCFAAVVLAGAYLLSLFQTDHVTVAGAVVGAAGTALFLTIIWRHTQSWLNCFGKGTASLEIRQTISREEWKRVLLLIVASLLIHLVFSMLIRMMLDKDINPIHALRIYPITDSIHYAEIAQYGYRAGNQGYDVLAQGDRALDLVFFPAYPALIRFMMVLIPDVMICGYLAAWIPWVGAGCMLYKLFRLDLEQSRAIHVLLIFCMLPGAIFYSVPMSESLFLLLTVSGIYFARVQKWHLAGMCGMLSAAARSAGVLVIVPLVAELAMQFDWSGFRPFRDPQERKRLIVNALWILPVPLGILYYLLLNLMLTGSMFTFMEYQKYYWGQGMTWFFSGLADQLNQLLHDPEGMAVRQGWNLIVGFASLTLMAFSAKKMRASYTLWFILYFAFSYGASRLLSGPRYMTVFFPLAIAIVQLSEGKKEIVFAALLLGTMVCTGCFAAQSGIC